MPKLVLDSTLEKKLFLKATCSLGFALNSCVSLFLYISRRDWTHLMNFLISTENFKSIANRGTLWMVPFNTKNISLSTFSLLISLSTLFGSFPLAEDKSNSKKNIFRRLSFMPRFASMIIQLNSVLLIGNLTLNISFISLLDTCVSDSSWNEDR